MPDTNRYLGLDLEDYATDPPLEEQDDRYWSRTNIIRELLPDTADVEVYSTGGYQGEMGFVIGLDGYYWLIKETYGSCSFCDGLLGADDSLEYGRSILRNAYAFDSEADARAFLREQDGYIWDRIKNEMAGLLDEVEPYE